MRVYLYEMVSGGGALLPAAITAEDTGLADINDFHDVATLISDGSQMLEQLVELFLLMPDVEVWVSVDSRLKQFGQQLKERTGVDGNQPFVLYADPQTPWAVFEECCRGADWTLIVAPELGGLLEDACGRCVVAGGRLLGSGLKLRQLGIDKQQLHLWADNHDIPMPPWGIVEAGATKFNWSTSKTLVKPIQGTGGVGIRVVGDSLPPDGKWLLETIVPGIPVSVVANLTKEEAILLPPCHQILGGNGGYEYLSAELLEHEGHQQRAWELSRRVLDALPLDGSSGWIGLDLILGDNREEDFLIEINPRVTSTISVLSELESFVPDQWSRSTNLTELMSEAMSGK